MEVLSSTHNGSLLQVIFKVSMCVRRLLGVLVFFLCECVSVLLSVRVLESGCVLYYATVCVSIFCVCLQRVS